MGGQFIGIIEIIQGRLPESFFLRLKNELTNILLLLFSYLSLSIITQVP